jgi:hypothetical protein
LSPERGREEEVADRHLAYPKLACHGDATNLPKHKRQEGGRIRHPAAQIRHAGCQFTGEVPKRG